MTGSQEPSVVETGGTLLIALLILWMLASAVLMGVTL